VVDHVALYRQAVQLVGKEHPDLTEEEVEQRYQPEIDALFQWLQTQQREQEYDEPSL